MPLSSLCAYGLVFIVMISQCDRAGDTETRASSRPLEQQQDSAAPDVKSSNPQKIVRLSEQQRSRTVLRRLPNRFDHANYYFLPKDWLLDGQGHLIVYREAVIWPGVPTSDTVKQQQIQALLQPYGQHYQQKYGVRYFDFNDCCCDWMSYFFSPFTHAAITDSLRDIGAEYTGFVVEANCTKTKMYGGEIPPPFIGETGYLFTGLRVYWDTGIRSAQRDSIRISWEQRMPNLTIFQPGIADADTWSWKTFSLDTFLTYYQQLQQQEWVDHLEPFLRSCVTHSDAEPQPN